MALTNAQRFQQRFQQRDPAFGIPQSTAQGGALTSSPVPTDFVDNVPGQVLGLTDEQFRPQAPTTTTEPIPTETGEVVPPQDNTDINAEIEGQAGEQLDFLAQQEAALRANQPSALAEAESQFGTSRSLLEGETARGERGLQTAQRGTVARKEDAQAAARRLFNELQLGGQQRFGGASSAGEAFSEISSREQQRQQGGIRRSFAESQAKIEEQRFQLNESFKNNLIQLEQTKQVAVNQANRDFQNKLLEIDRLRTEVGVNKSLQRLQALTDLRNQVFQIDSQNRQFQQQMEAQRQANDLALSNASRTSTGVTAGADDAFQDFAQTASVNPTSNLNVQSNTLPTTPEIRGAVNREEDQPNFFQRLFSGA